MGGSWKSEYNKTYCILVPNVAQIITMADVIVPKNNLTLPRYYNPKQLVQNLQ